MLRNYFLVALRSLSRQKLLSFLNIIGLAIALASTFLIFLWIQDERSYDSFQPDAEQLFRVEEDQFYSGKEPYHVNVTPFIAGPTWKSEIPEIEEMTRISYTGGLLVKYGENKFFEDAMVCVDSGIFSMFRFDFISGDPLTAFRDPYSIVLNEPMAEKYFGKEDPLGKTLTVEEKYEFTVTAVVKKYPSNSNLRFDALIPADFMKTRSFYAENWGTNSITTYIKLGEAASDTAVNRKLTEIVKQHNPDTQTVFMAAPMTRIHLFGYFGYSKDQRGIQLVYIFAAVALFILVIACINFMNLTTARSVRRSKEIGLRKTNGASRIHLIFQFLSESYIQIFMALLLALILVEVLLGSFNQLSGKEISPEAIFRGEYLAGYLIIFIFTGLMAGLYPAFFLSKPNPVTVMKGTGNARFGKGLILRKILVALQFVLSVVLITGSIVSSRQLNYMVNKPLGFDKDYLVYIPMRNELKNNYLKVKDKFLESPRILGVTGSLHLPSSIGSNSGGIDWEGKDPDLVVLVSLTTVDFDYTETLKINVVKGRSFSREISTDLVTDTTGPFLINESLARLIGKEDIIGSRLNFIGVTGEIIGVMEDFHFNSVNNPIEPLALCVTPPSWFNVMLIRLDPGSWKDGLAYLEKSWQELLPQYPFDYHFMDTEIEETYQSDRQMTRLIMIFSLLGILIACLGLFGLVALETAQRTREISIRKTLGSSAGQVAGLLVYRFLSTVVISVLIAIPVSWFITKTWLQEFAYRTGLEWWIFALSAFLALSVSLLTVLYHTLKASATNPGEALRYE
ncbi:MAG: ABC transporter permease [Bacteroidota bacterium]